MNEFFASIYDLFSRLGFYSDDLGMYLHGWDCNTQMFALDPLYSSFGLMMIFISLIIAGIFYYIINHPRFNRLRHWLLVLGINALILFLIPYIQLSDHLSDGRMGTCLQVAKSDVSGFALVNLIVGTIVYIAASFAMRWWSRNASCTPYPL